MDEKMTLILDIDGTICPIKKKTETYEELVPYPEIVEKIKMYHSEKVKIVLFTSRNMNSFNGNIGLINANTAKSLLIWLEQWQIPYDEIIYGKPWPGKFGFYVDDRAVRPNEFLKYTPKELSEICQNSRVGEFE